jgi:cytidylate kinase
LGLGYVIAIDGPGGSGKSTVAGELARRLGCERLDTGAMYRAVTLLALRAGTDLLDEVTLAGLAQSMAYDAGPPVCLDGENVSDAIRMPEVDRNVSQVAAHAKVRQELVRRQRAWVADHDGGVVEGRDIGSVVMPEARLKVYLTADPAERARRRADPELARRDGLDSGRAASPLVIPDGSVVIDSTGKPVEEVVEEVLSHL